MDELNELRTKLDAIDAEMMRLFAQRMETAKEIGRVKDAYELPLSDPEREKEVIETRLALLPEELHEGGERLVRLLMDEAKKVRWGKRNLYLIGMPDCGKTRTGKKLAAMTGLPLVDTDKLIMKSVGKTIDELFDSVGEAGFRELEASVLRAVAKKGGSIVALGGGTPLYVDNAEVMRATGFTVFLDRRLESLFDQNIKNRPLLRGDVNANIERLYHERHDRYAACADFTVDPDADGAAEEIMREAVRRKSIHG